MKDFTFPLIAKSEEIKQKRNKALRFKDNHADQQ
jgi:hypothetical protein